MTKPVSMSEFYEAVGVACTGWNILEEGLRDVFTRLVLCATARTVKDAPPEAFWVLGGIFYSSTNLRARLQMITDIVDRIVKDDAIKAEWHTCRNRVSDLYKRRNILAHGGVWSNEDASGAAAFIRGSMFDVGARSEMSYAQVCASNQSFRRMAERLTNLATAINASLVVSRTAAPPDSSDQKT